MQTDSLKQPILLQAIRSGTSVGANYQEAEGRESPKDFIHKVMISKKEAKETIYWLKLLENGYDVKSAQLTYLIDECDQLIRIFGKISTSAQTDIWSL